MGNAKLVSAKYMLGASFYCKVLTYDVTTGATTLPCNERAQLIGGKWVCSIHGVVYQVREGKFPG